MALRFIKMVFIALAVVSCAGNGGTASGNAVPDSAKQGDSLYVFTVKGVTFSLMHMPGGTFSMGQTFDQGIVRNPDIHQVYLDGFAIGSKEVDQALWKAVMGGNPSAVQDPSAPVTRITWKDAVKFTGKLSRLTGVQFRLPTEAEWEFAARRYPSMAGGVWEWCSDWWREKWDNEPEFNPAGPESGTGKALRGNSSAVVKPRILDRKELVPQGKSADVGMRLALSVGEPCPSECLDVYYNRIDREKTEDLTVETFKVGPVSFRMKPVEGGKFMMGGDSDPEKASREDEFPLHEVTLDSFKMGEFEVTCDLWKAVMGSLPPMMEGGRYPVGNVSWYEVQLFIVKLNALTGRKFRLPTEAEWEYAAGGGTKAKKRNIYAGQPLFGYVRDVAVFDQQKPSVVGTKRANELGLYDMSGNVWEWCQDRMSVYTAEPAVNPTGPEVSESGLDYRVMRGGSAMSRFTACRISNRSENYANAFKSNIGFRLAL
jgi:formylglycine-generating enzyme required for sulfatase activity